MKTDQTLEEHIRFLEEYLLKSEVRASPQELANILADDFVEFGSSGRIYDKKQIITALQQGTGREMRLMEFKVKLIGQDVALATYRTAWYLEPKGEPRYALHSSIWRIDQGRWRIVFHQGAPIDTGNAGFHQDYNNDRRLHSNVENRG